MATIFKTCTDEVRHKDCSTGVVHNHSAEWANEDIDGSSIDLGWLEYVAEYGEENSDSFDSTGPWLVGFYEVPRMGNDVWYHVKSQREDVDDVFLALDPDAEYSAIVNEINTQIVRSRWVQFCHGCSPCYPNQGDLDTPIDPYLDPTGFNNGIVSQGDAWAYTYPPEVWGSAVEDRVIVEVTD